MATDAPLTYGQLSTWRSMETFARDRLMEVNVPATWDLRGLATDQVLSAFRRLVDRHPSLRTTYHVVDGQPVQRVHDGVEPRIEIVERDGVAPDDPARTTRDLYQIPFPVTDDVGWHGRLVTVRGEPVFLALSLSHMVVDLWSVQELEADFRRLAADPRVPVVPGLAPVDLAAAQRGEAWQARRRGAEKYWQKVLSTGPVRNLPTLPARAAERRVQATLASHHLATLAARAAKLHSASPQSVLMAATAAALARVVGADRVMLSLMSNNRFDAEWRPIISTMNQLVPLICDVDPQTSLAKFLGRAHWGALLAYRYSCYDVDRASELIADSAARNGTDFSHDCWFNYLIESEQTVEAPDATDAPVEPAAPAELTWTPPARHAGHPCYVRVTGQDRMVVGLRVDPDLISEGTAVHMLRTMALAVLRMATDPESTVGALDDPGTDALVPWLFPHEVPDPPR
ncbi:MAG TPA: condensation domain-containing protein [Micromonosporaceae bacterium]